MAGEGELLPPDIRIKAPLAMGRSAEEASLHDATTEVGVPSPMQAAAFLDRPSSQ